MCWASGSLAADRGADLVCRAAALHVQSGAATDSTEAALEKEHEERTKVKNIDMVQIGAYQLDTWYYSPYPEEVSLSPFTASLQHR